MLTGRLEEVTIYDARSLDRMTGLPLEVVGRRRQGALDADPARQHHGPSHPPELTGGTTVLLAAILGLAAATLGPADATAAAEAPGREPVVFVHSRVAATIAG